MSDGGKGRGGRGEGGGGGGVEWKIVRLGKFFLRKTLNMRAGKVGEKGKKIRFIIWFLYIEHNPDIFDVFTYIYLV